MPRFAFDAFAAKGSRSVVIPVPVCDLNGSTFCRLFVSFWNWSCPLLASGQHPSYASIRASSGVNEVFDMGIRSEARLHSQTAIMAAVPTRMRTGPVEEIRTGSGGRNEKVSLRAGAADLFPCGSW